MTMTTMRRTTSAAFALALALAAGACLPSDQGA